MSKEDKLAVIVNECINEVSDPIDLSLSSKLISMHKQVIILHILNITALICKIVIEFVGILSDKSLVVPAVILGHPNLVLESVEKPTDLLKFLFIDRDLNLLSSFLR